MARPIPIILIIVLLVSNSFSDTFTNRQTGTTFSGYSVSKKQRGKTQVRVDGKTAKYIDLKKYEVRRNYLGRKNKVIAFSIKDAMDFIYETEALEKALQIAADQGPLFILIEIDTPGGKTELVQRISSAITALDNCTTVAFLNGGKFGGAFSQGAIAALACDVVYMKQGTTIGGRTSYYWAGSYEEPPGQAGQTLANQSKLRWLAYVLGIAQRYDELGLFVMAMADENIEVLEVEEDGKHSFINSKDKKAKQTTVNVLTDKATLLNLTAPRAAQIGLIKKVVTRQSDVLKNLRAGDAKLMRDNRVLRAKREFKRAMRKINRMLTKIENLEQQSANLSQQLDILEKEIRAFNEYGNVESYNVINRGDAGLPFLGIDDDQWERMLNRRDSVLFEAIATLEDLMAEYTKTIAEVEKYPDLKKRLKILEDSLQFTDDKYRRIRATPRYELPEVGF